MDEGGTDTAMKPFCLLVAVVDLTGQRHARPERRGGGVPASSPVVQRSGCARCCSSPGAVLGCSGASWSGAASDAEGGPSVATADPGGGTRAEGTELDCRSERAGQRVSSGDGKARDSPRRRRRARSWSRLGGRWTWPRSRSGSSAAWSSRPWSRSPSWPGPRMSGRAPLV